MSAAGAKVSALSALRARPLATTWARRESDRRRSLAIVEDNEGQESLLLCVDKGMDTVRCAERFGKELIGLFSSETASILSRVEKNELPQSKATTNK